MFHSKFFSGNRNSFIEFHGWFRNFRIFKNRLIFGDFGGTKISQNSVAFKIISIFRLIPIFMGMWNFRNFMLAHSYYSHLDKGHVTHVISRLIREYVKGPTRCVCKESVRMADVKFLTKNNYFRSKLRNSKNNTNSNRILKWTLDPSFGHF